MLKRYILLIGVIAAITVFSVQTAQAFWVWTPKSKTMVNPKWAAKDTPREQFDWAMHFYKNSDFKRAAEEFIKLTESFPDSDLAPDAQYYAGRSYEELGKYYFAFKQYQKTIDDYPYTKRMEEILGREYNIANIFQTEETPKLMELELSESMGRAVEIYKKIVENAPFGMYADKSLYKMAECYRRMMKYNEAIEAYEKIIKDYPESSFVSEAKYQLAYTRYEASLAPEYDQESTEEALKEFKRIKKTTPVPAIAQEAEKVLDELRSKKANSIMKIAEFYERRGKYRSAVIYYQDVTGKFPGTKVANEAQARIERLQKRIKN
ncbi:MAG: outer membrane protein assembly factor BamD [Candidatus Omnitrophica bacterium]|nr:outer membrane protein assembly factor BamD [Candidatus Omnitrophota bacterium]